MAIYYVRPDGNNTNDGLSYTVGRAWATISKAASVMVAGDVVFIAPGKYRETITPTNSGTIGNPIRYIGDRKAEWFDSVVMGDITISGMNTESDTIITRANAIISGTKNYIDIINIDVENCGGSGATVIALGSNCNIKNCNLVKGIISTAISVISTCSIENCNIVSQNYNIYISGNSSKITNCILKCTGVVDVIYISGAYLFNVYHCIIEGSYIPPYNSTLTLYGCVWNCGYSATANISINLDATTKTLNAKGCTFIGKGSVMRFSSATTLTGTKFKDLGELEIYTAGSTLSNCEFENCIVGLVSSVSINSQSNYFKFCKTGMSGNTISANSCRFYAVGQILSGTGTNNTPVYGETDVVAGIVASATNPISGTKSLKIAGYDYGTVFIQWVPCEKGKPKTVKMKIKRNSATQGTSIRLGDQVVQMSNNIKRVGSGWDYASNASLSGGGTIISNIKDDYVEYSFTGTGVRLITSKHVSYGIAGIRIDGGAETNVDLYAGTTVFQQNVFEVTGLTNGTHTIKVRHTGTKNASSSDYNVATDAFEYFNGTTWTRVEAETVSTSVETIDVTYTHHKTELVPLFINTRCNTSGGDFVQYDDIQ